MSDGGYIMTAEEARAYAEFILRDAQYASLDRLLQSPSLRAPCDADGGFYVPEGVLRDTVQRPGSPRWTAVVDVWTAVDTMFDRRGIGDDPDPEPVRADSFDEWRKKSAKVLEECGRRGL